MTISTTTNKAIGLGNGVTTNWPFLFLIPAASQLYVYYTDTAGNITAISSGNYSVSGIANPNGGSVTYPLSGSPIATGTSLTVYRLVPYQQLTDVTNQGAFYPEVYEAALDYLTMETQQLAEIAGRSMVLPLTVSGVSTTLPVPVANMALVWNAAATALVNAAAAGVITLPVSIANGGTGATTAAAALAALGGLPFAGGTMTGDLYMQAASIIQAEGAAVASAGTIDIWATDGNARHITGNTGPITSMGTAPQAGAMMILIFDSTPTLTQSANLNVNNGGSDLVIEAGDLAIVYADTTTQLDVFVIRKSGKAISGGNVTLQVITATGTYTPTTGMVKTLAIATGGGAGGGGANVGGSGVSGGGGGGGTAIRLLTAAQVGASQSVTIGAAGAGGTNVPGAGANGGTTSIGALLSATGGTGGAAQAGAGDFIGGAGGLGSGGDLNFTGGAGGPGEDVAVPAGFGGSSFFGGGPAGPIGAAAGNNAGVYGAGGSGAYSTGGTGRVGGNGSAGVTFFLDFH